MEESQGNSRSGEFRNFGLLLIVLLIVVLVVAFSRPFIFGKVIPAVLGDGTSAASQMPDEEEVEDDGIDETAVDEENGANDEATDSSSDSDPVDETDLDSESETDDDGTSEGDTTSETDGASETDADEDENPEDLSTPVSTIEYVVQSGDTLTSIAKRFDTEISIIAEANDLANPNRLLVGSTLLIPQPE